MPGAFTVPYGRLAAVRGRIRQGLAGLRPRLPTECAAAVGAELTTAQAAAFYRLSRFDQAHLCRAYLALRAAGETDRDLLVAALLHDVGKASAEGRVRLIHRVARVLLARSAPAALTWLARLPAPRWRVGFALAVLHAELGAHQAAALGCTPRTCWLIAHHEDAPPPPDEALRRLIEADHAACP